MFCKRLTFEDHSSNVKITVLVPGNPEMSADEWTVAGLKALKAYMNLGPKALKSLKGWMVYFTDETIHRTIKLS